MTTQAAILWGSLGPDSHVPDPTLPTQSLVHLAQPWADASGYRAFPATLLQRCWDAGQITLLDWISWNLSNRADVAFSLPTIVAGRHDAFLQQWATDAAAWKHPLLLRFDPEMNGTWLPYGNQPALFAPAWRHIHDIFTAEGATNVTWHWCPNVVAPAGTGDKQSTAPELLPAYFPGDEYVDWTGADGYNGYVGRKAPWMTFSQIMSGYPGWLGDTYTALTTIAPTKPICIGETACWDDPRKPGWILDMLAIIPQDFPEIRAVSYFNWDGGTSSKWPLTGDSLAAFKLGVSSPVYLPAGVWVPAAVNA